MLRAKGLISERELAAALALQADVGGLIGLVLVRIGALSEQSLLEVLSEQLGLAVQTVREAPTSAQAAPFLAESRTPLAWWLDRQAIAWRPGRTEGPKVVCAAVQPLDPALIERLNQLAGGEVELRLAPRSLVGAILEDLARGVTVTSGAADARQLRELALETPVVDFVNSLFSEALARGASDVHVEPFEDRFQVRMRIDGILTIARTGPRSSFDAVCSRIKLLSGMDIGERRLPQDGRQSIRVAGADLDLRVSTLPSAWGESVVLRLLGKSTRLPELSELGLNEDQASQLLGLVDRPEGVVLISGPTGSGKTTTIYRLLAHLNDGARKIVTVEDPVEFDLPGVVQVKARSDIGLSFAVGLRSILRQDPDVIMVGEIRDSETARIAVQAAMTGHLVISTVHTNSALAAAARLVDLGVEDYLLADVLRGLVGQRLVRRLCPDCAAPADAEDVRASEALRPSLIGKAGAWGKTAWKTPGGCERCDGLGYRGRLGVYEIVRSTSEIQHEIRRRASEEQLTRAARQDGFLTLFEDGYRKARAGLTTLAEVRRVTGTGEAEVETGSAPPTVMG
ncbi:MAG TPA: GspE/PulE family protein [Caulobacteraceae bacterium]